ncbi:hypothetical protein PoB_001310800 [Plakobranchus ocellatus]|uniref:Uncharacterized protein n=1 Tax=Plakobranchus ocellatus TaxID=259542 RepID=A0AAV3YWI8_9GAST|nr:hypothetical protein PoB_001310800 [Plakobranchus ocellatus]
MDVIRGISQAVPSNAGHSSDRAQIICLNCAGGKPLHQSMPNSARLGSDRGEIICSNFHPICLAIPDDAISCISQSVQTQQ